MQLYNPFDNLHFDENTCFLSGDDLENKEFISIFPEWIMDKFELRGKRFKLMDKINELYYDDLKLPCSPSVKVKFDALEREIETAFKNGYEAVKALDTYKLFVWISKITYGALYHDLVIEQKLKARQSAEMNLADVLKERFGLFHLMLQSFIQPITFKEGRKPWSISVVQLKYSKDILNYKDDAVNMTFFLGVNGFGIIACLLDNETVIEKMQPLLDKIGDTVLHPVQFEELTSRFQYYSYLLDYKPKYRIRSTENGGYEIESLPIETDGTIPVFDQWNDETFATVLEGAFKPWGLTKKEIHTPPNAPISFLENEVTYEFIPFEKISLPY